MARNAAAQSEEKQRPAHWDKMVSAAYLRALGATQKDAAKAVDRAERTLRDWEKGELWPEALAEAEGRWLVDLKHASMKSVLENVKAGNAVLGFQVLERLNKELAPPKQKLEHTGKDGGPIQTKSELAGLSVTDLLARRQELLADSGSE